MAKVSITVTIITVATDISNASKTSAIEFIKHEKGITAMRKLEKVLLSRNSKINEVDVLDLILNAIEVPGIDGTSSFNTCFYFPISYADAINILACHYLRYQVKVMHTCDALAASPYLKKGQTFWLEVTRNFKGFKDLKNLKIEVWITCAFPPSKYQHVARESSMTITAISALRPISRTYLRKETPYEIIRKSFKTKIITS